MSYIALARKWRPNAFSQLVGQEHIKKALTHSLEQQRLHHAYLFTGTRGVGKTSIARLLAKALNCEQGIGSTPCLQCQTCLAIEQGRFIDLIEIDGASKTRVEDTRELLENVQYSPTSGRYKIYLIDEVHMLSQHSFNALLKTLEEPPQHVKFLLATTDPQKLPITVLSRCLQFNLKPLTIDVIEQHLMLILKDESIGYEQEAIEIIAKAARGSMRDALSLLDQTIAMGHRPIEAMHVKSMLGFTQRDYAIELLQHLAKSDAQKLLTVSREIASVGGDVLYVLEEMLTYLHQISISQHLPKAHPLMSPSKDILALQNQFSLEDVQLFYQIGLKAMEDIHLAPTLAIGFEMTMLRMLTFKPAPLAPMPSLAHETHEERTQPPAIDKTPSTEKASIASQPSLSNPSEAVVSEPQNKVVDVVAEQMPTDKAAKTDMDFTSSKAPVASPPNKSITSTPSITNSEDWGNIIATLKLKGLAQTAMEHTEFVKKDHANIQLRVDKGHRSLFTPMVLKRIEQALAQHYQETIKLTLLDDKAVLNTLAQKKKIEHAEQQRNIEDALQKDAFFNQIVQTFSAEVVKDSIASVQDDL